MTPASAGSVDLMRSLAEIAGQDLDTVAAQEGIYLSSATSADLRWTGRVIGQAMGITSVSVYG